MPRNPLGSVLQPSQYVSVQHGNNEWNFFLLLLLIASLHLHFLYLLILGCFTALEKHFITYLILSIYSRTLNAFKSHVQS